MALPAFDTLQIFEDLEKAGFDEPQAKAISAVVRRVHDSSDVATKQDIAELRHEIGDLRKDIDTRLANMKFELLRWFFGIALAQTGLLVALKLWARLTPSSPRSISEYTLPNIPNFLFFDQKYGIARPSRRLLNCLRQRFDRRAAFDHACRKAQHPPALHCRGVVLAAVRLKAQCPRMPPLRPNAAFASDGDLPVRPGKIKLPPAHRIKAILPLRLRQLCDTHPHRKLRFQYAHRLPRAGPVGNVQPALLAQEFDRHERVSPWQLHLSRQAGGFRRHLCFYAAFRFACAAGTGIGHLHSGRTRADTLWS